MTISDHHIHNVLRSYSRQLTQGRRRLHAKGGAERKGPDSISISPRARRKAVIDKVTSDIVDRIIHKSPRGDTQRERSGQVKARARSDNSLKKENSVLFFTLIDKEKGEVTKSISFENSEFLEDHLEENTKRNTDNN
ncbi:MAG: hypothetical protein JSV60_12215 [Desulfobacterales bacterium]|nr:MAG: hypothetical protein JSV60_12215 [Desulfobacterales bacterium]